MLPLDDSAAAAAGASCSGCNAILSPSLLACPSCHRLRYADRLKQLAAKAEDATQRGALSDALQAWRDARDLLPAGIRQHQVVEAKIAALSQSVSSVRPHAGLKPRSWWGWLVAMAALVLSKGKLLAIGLTKAGTLLSMLVAFGVYWTAWGWRFAAGFVLSIFVHEMGHVAALRRYGVRATAPMFLPGIGAVVRFGQNMEPAAEARVGLAGPLWGCAAAAVAYGVALATGSQLWGAIAHVGAWVNLFNLLPIIPLDGGRGYRALGRLQRLAMVPLIFGAWYVTGEGLLLLILAVAMFRVLENTAVADDGPAFALFVGLIVALSLLSKVAGTIAGQTPI